MPSLLSPTYFDFFWSLSGGTNACHYSELQLLWNELLLWFEVLMVMLMKGKVFLRHDAGRFM